MSLSVVVRYNRKYSIFRPGARLPVWVHDADDPEALTGGRAQLEALPAGAGTGGSGVVVDSADLSLVEAPYVRGALLGDLTVRREPLESLGYPAEEVELLVRVRSGSGVEVTKPISLGHGVEQHRWYADKSEKRWLKPKLKGVQLDVEPGPHRFGSTLDVHVVASKPPLEVGLRCQEFGVASGVSQGQARQMNTRETIWERCVEAVEPDATLSFTVPSDQPPTHDGSIGVRWSIFARPVGKPRKAIDVPVTVEA